MPRWMIALKRWNVVKGFTTLHELPAKVLLHFHYSFMGRNIVTRHKEFGFYKPTTYTITYTLVDIPL